MKLYVKQNLFRLLESYNITDCNGNIKYYVETEFFSIGHCFKLYNSNNEFLYEIKQKIFTLLPKYLLLDNSGNEIASIVKNFTFFTDSYEIDKLGWIVSGDLFAHDYDIICNNSVIAKIHKKWFSFGDSYEFDIADDKNIELVLAVIIMIDQIIDSRESR